MTDQQRRELAGNWYRPQDIHEALNKPNWLRTIWDNFGPAPQDVQSMEFAEWITNHLWAAMVKGMWIGEQRAAEEMTGTASNS